LAHILPVLPVDAAPRLVQLLCCQSHGKRCIYSTVRACESTNERPDVPCHQLLDSNEEQGLRTPAEAAMCHLQRPFYYHRCCSRAGAYRPAGTLALQPAATTLDGSWKHGQPVSAAAAAACAESDTRGCRQEYSQQGSGCLCEHADAASQDGIPCRTADAGAAVCRCSYCQQVGTYVDTCVQGCIHSLSGEGQYDSAHHRNSVLHA
jgi:hypothetical protein